jgi:dihydroflavonol-4-reductase
VICFQEGFAFCYLIRMRVGITGANGFIGNHLVRDVLRRGHEAVSFLQPGSRMSLFEDIEAPYETVWGDIRQAGSIDPFVGRCDVVFHLAGFNRYWACDPAIFRDVNYMGTRNVAEACLKHGVSKLVHVSSCITLGASQDPVPRNEESPFNLEGIRFLYAETKKAGEDLVKQMARTRGLPAVIVNPASAVGELDCGPTPIGKPISDICNGRWPVYVSGGACFIDVREVVRGLWLALERGRTGEQYLLAGDNLTNRQFMSQVAMCAGLKPPQLRIPKALLSTIAHGGEWFADHYSHKHPALTVGMTALIGKFLYFDGTKARDELGFIPGPSSQAISRSVRWFQERAKGFAGERRHAN